MNARLIGLLGLALCTVATACNTSSMDGPSPGATDVSVSALGATSMNVAAEQSLRHLRESYGIAGVDEIWAERVNSDFLGMTHTRVMQTVDGVRVLGGEAIVHHAPEGDVVAVTDNLVRDITVDTQPVFGRERSIDMAVQAFGRGHALTQAPEAELVVLRHEGVDYLTWRVQLWQLDGSEESSMPIYFIDAHTREIVMSYDNLQHTSLSDTDKRTYDMNNGTSYSSAVIGDSSDAVALEAHTNAGHSLAYYLDVHNRDSYTGNGTVVKSYVHYSTDYVNAYWDGQRLTYGDGDGVRSAPLTVLDVVAHEFTHAVTSYSANLIYSNESGALNEGTSDIMAAAVEAHVEGVTSGTYEVGEDCWLERSALRYMYDPMQDGRSRDHYSTRYTGFDDNGGVHMNSGIANLFFYLLAEGGQHPKEEHQVATVTGIGIQAAADIWYRALTTYMTSSTNFSGARTATLNATADLFGASSDQHCQVQNAWAEVGVGSVCGGGGDPGTGTELQNGVPVSDLSGSTGDMTYFTMEVPDGATDLAFTISGGSGDADLYVKFGSQPTTSSYDCRPYKSGNSESCTFPTPSAGTWHVAIRAYSSYSGVSLEGSYTASGTGGWSGSASPGMATVDNGEACTSLSVGTSGDASLVQLDLSGTHDYRSILRGTLSHGGITVEAFPTGTFPTGAGTFSLSSRAIAGMSGDASGTWTLCIIDTDGYSDTGVLNTWSVHD